VPYFCNRLREERESLGLSQQDFADKCGVTMRSQRNYEKGDRMPDASYLAFAAELGVDVLYVVTGARSQPVEPPAAAPLNREEEALLDNYRHCPPEGKIALKTTSAALAQRKGKKSAAGGE
jgi:transcriptional regulator with XRE-family HTH domain